MLLIYVETRLYLFQLSKRLFSMKPYSIISCKITLLPLMTSKRMEKSCVNNHTTFSR